MSLHQLHNAAMQQNKALFNRFADIIAENVDADEEKTLRLKEVLKSYSNTLRHNQTIAFAKSHTKNMDQNPRDFADKNLDQLKEEYEEEKARRLSEDLMKPVCRNDETFVKIENLVQEYEATNAALMHEENDDEITATQQQISLIDPITKKEMTDPVRNQICGHVYQRDSIIEMIRKRKNKGVKCPQMGCNNKQNIDPRNLVEAPDYNRAIYKKRMNEL